MNLKFEKKTCEWPGDRTGPSSTSSVKMTVKATIWASWLKKPSSRRSIRQIGFLWGYVDRCESQDSAELESKNSCLSTLAAWRRTDQTWRRISPPASAAACSSSLWRFEGQDIFQSRCLLTYFYAWQFLLVFVLQSGVSFSVCVQCCTAIIPSLILQHDDAPFFFFFWRSISKEAMRKKCSVRLSP